LAYALDPKFYDEDLIAQRNRMMKGMHKDREVANGVKRAFMRIFLASLQIKLTEEFASFATRLHEYSNILALYRRTMNLVRWWHYYGANGVHLKNLATRNLSQVVSPSSIERNWSTSGFIHSMKRNRLIL
jgi:hypothetical protein